MCVPESRVPDQTYLVKTSVQEEKLNSFNTSFWGNPHSEVVNVFDSDIVVSEVEFQALYNVHFQTNTLGNGVNPLYSFTYGLNTTHTFLLKGVI